MKNNTIYSENHIRFFEEIILKKRLEIIDIVNDQILLNNIKNVLDVGTTSDTKNFSSNLIVKSLKNIEKFYSISDQKIISPFFEKTLQKSIVENFTNKDIENFKADLVLSSATIEHVGNLENQKMMLKNMIKLAKKMIIITTPNRFHPVDFHTKIPFIHWLPKNIHRRILRFLNLNFFSKEENLNLLTKSDFHKFLENENILYEFKDIKLLGFNSNIILIGKK